MKKEEKLKIINLLTVVAILSVAIVSLIIGRDYLTILIITVSIFVALGINLFFRGIFLSNYDGGWYKLIGAMVIIVSMISVVCVPMSLYTNAISLANRYNASCDTVAEMETLLLKYSEDPNLADGLEALKLKETLGGAIKDKNNLKAEVNIWLDNPFMPFKDVLTECLN